MTEADRKLFQKMQVAQRLTALQVLDVQYRAPETFTPSD